MSETPKGLATVAFPKTRLDEGHDHLGLFEPLVLDALLRLYAPDFLAGDVKAIIHERTGIVLPTSATQTLVGRCVKRGLVARAGGRFHRTAQPVQDPEFDAARSAIQAEQRSLGQALADYATPRGVQFESADRALAALATFVSDNKVHLVLEEPLPDSPLERSSLDRKLTRLIARFITEHCLNSPELREALAALTEGMLLQDTLLLRDIAEAAQRFQNLLVAFDTGVLFAAIDLTGTANAVAAKEGLTLLREAGARTIAFGETVAEMRRILAVYEERVGTSAGMLSLHPTALTHHVVTKRLSPADIRVISATLEKRLTKVGVTVREVPPRDARYTLEEKALAKCLIDVERPDPEAPRIRHDVDCVAAILTLRAGRIATSIERSGSIFCTSSGRVVRNVQRWYFAEGEEGVPPIVHQAALTSIAWLKKPAAAPGLKMHELAGLCFGAMRPTRATWTKFVVNLRRLRADGNITDDETAAIVASELTEPLLAQLDDDLDPDSDSITEAIERVRDEYRREAQAVASSAVREAREEVAMAQRTAEEAVRAARAEAEVAQRAADEALATKTALLTVIEKRVSRSSRRVANGLFMVSAALIIVAVALALPGAFDALGGATKWVARAILLAAGALGVYSTVQGRSLKDLRAWVEDRIAQRMRRRWLPEGRQG